MNISTCEKEYAYNPTIWNVEDKKMNAIKWIVNNELTLPEKRLFLLYVELASLRKVAKELNLTLTMVHQSIKDIKNKIIQSLKKRNITVQETYDIEVKYSDTGTAHITTVARV